MTMPQHCPTLDLDLDDMPLLDAPWSVRFGLGTKGRTALEVYNAGLLLDILVARPLAADLLRGARRASPNGRPSVLAWGHLPPDGVPPAVVCSQRNHTRKPAEAIPAAGAFWLATLEGCFDRVTVTRRDGASERLRVRAGWSR
ncbi:hypothetical protein [Streptacidiphilus carbonis]|jgi:hypothetical protein|uniref:hypothetical protein n=1 Tax=Streptacidiphilus carbonis TaxID=105422 RepID=UPI0005A9486F|nr:hypothetical protein [Streptacidiphilus carbonis]